MLFQFTELKGIVVQELSLVSSFKPVSRKMKLFKLLTNQWDDMQYNFLLIDAVDAFLQEAQI